MGMQEIEGEPWTGRGSGYEMSMGDKVVERCP